MFITLLLIYHHYTRTLRKLKTHILYLESNGKHLINFYGVHWNEIFFMFET